MADTPDYNETLEILRAAANKSDLITNKYHDVLVYDENSDIDLGDGEFTPSLSKRVKQFVTSNGGPVLSVNDESGHVVLGDVSNMNKNDLMKAENLYDGTKNQHEINTNVYNRTFTNMIDLRSFGIEVPNTVSETNNLTSQEKLAMSTSIHAAIKKLPEGSTLYIPPNVYWQNTFDKVYASMPNYTKIIDDSGWDSRYGGIWQSASVVWYKTGESVSGTNGNTHVLRGEYHPAFGIDNDAPNYTGGCRSSVVFRFSDNTNTDLFQFGADKTKEGYEHIGIATYGTTAPKGTKVMKVGGQSSIAPHAFVYNNEFVVGTSYIYGKMQKTLSQTDEQWQTSAHVTRYTQPANHTGTFTNLYLTGNTVKFRTDIQNDGRFQMTSSNGGVTTISADGTLYGKRTNVVNSALSVTINKALSDTLYTNLMQTANTTYTLPKAEVGLTFKFNSPIETFKMIIKPNSEDTIIGYNQAATITSSGVIGDAITLTAISSTQWLIEHKTGNWI